MCFLFGWILIAGFSGGIFSLLNVEYSDELVSADNTDSTAGSIFVFIDDGAVAICALFVTFAFVLKQLL